MDDKDQHFNREESRVTVDEDANQVDNEDGKNARDIAGPSGCLLPGAVPKTNLQKTGLSKSENNIRHIITPKDVANALNSISKTEHQPNQNTININLNDLKIPPYAKVKTNKESALNEVRKLVASYFKHNNDAATVEAVNLRNISTTMHVGQDLHASNLVSQVHRNDDVTISIPLPNEVLLPNTPPKVHSVDNKKKTGNISERSDFGIGARDSLSSIGSNVCRICMTRGKERLISPCNCKGSLANVHLTCLERWLNQVGRNHCELCGYSYPAIRTPRYTVLEALRLWFGNPRNRSHLQSDCLIFWLLSTVTAGLLTVCIVGTQYFVIEGNKFGKHRELRKEEGIPHRITETAMNFFMAIVLCGYTVTVYLLWKEHYVTWNRWRRANVNVRLLLARDAS